MVKIHDGTATVSEELHNNMPLGNFRLRRFYESEDTRVRRPA